MKIEKINDNQIRCTLTRQDLADRQINLRELAYGSEKAKGLFQDMIQQANYEFGFDASDIPLMVEAIPLSKESLILQITKVEYPDELDTRFSRFSETDAVFDEDFLPNSPAPKGADDILGIFNKLKDSAERQKAEGQSDEAEVPTDLTRLFEFSDIEQAERLSRTLGTYYKGRNYLYKDDESHLYYLMAEKNEHTPEEFNRVCNIICEYAAQKNYTPAVGAYFAEHGNRVLGPNALQMLADL